MTSLSEFNVPCRRSSVVVGELVSQMDYERTHTFSMYDCEVNSTEPFDRNVEMIILA